MRLFTKVGLLASSIGGAIYWTTNKDNVASMGIVRFGRAALTAGRIAAHYKFLFNRIDKSDPGYADELHLVHLQSALLLHQLCCANGGAWIKVGQHIGTLDYLLPEEYVSTMKVLHSEAPQSPLPDLMDVLREDLGKEVEDMFVEFDPQPLGTASLAQVHRAKMADGREVAVKIQHPRVKAHSAVDMQTMQLLVDILGWLFPEFQYDWLAEETKRNLPLELDFLNEGSNCERVAQHLAKFKFLKVPKIYWDLSSDRVLTMEYCEGGKVDDLQYIQENKISVDKVTERLGELYSEMIFVQGYVHCDPHPGNVLVRPSKNGPEIVLLDHGLYQTLSEEFRVRYSQLWMSMLHADMENIRKHAQALNVGDLYPILACMLTARSWDAIQAGISRHKASEQERAEFATNAGNFLLQITTVLARVPRQLLLLIKTNDVVRGIEATLQSQPQATAFINMSRCCVKAVCDWELHRCPNWRCRVKTELRRQLELTRISLYWLYLRLLHSPLLRWWNKPHSSHGGWG